MCGGVRYGAGGLMGEGGGNVGDLCGCVGVGGVGGGSVGGGGAVWVMGGGVGGREEDEGVGYT